MENYLNIKKLTKGAPYQFYRELIWIYVFLLIFEGALRKWVLPGLSTPLLMVRDPIAIWLTCVGIQRGWIRSKYAIVMMFISTLSFIITMVVGHHNLFVAFFGWRIYFFHFPMIFVMGKIMTRDDLIKMSRFILYISIPMTVLVFMQFHSPQTAWVNIGVGGEGSSAYYGTTEYLRPSGTFSFTSGYVMFQAVVGCVLCYYLLMNETLPKRYQFNKVELILFAACYIFAIPTSVSRTNFFQTLVIILFVFVAVIRQNKLRIRFLKFFFIAVFAVLLILITGIGNMSFDALSDRFELANEAEGGVEGTINERYIGGLLGALVNFNIPILGYGIGLGTNVGAKLMGGNMYSFGFNAEIEWSRIIGECGMFIGWIIIGIRTLFSVDILIKAYRCLVRRLDLLPWGLSAGMMLTVPQGQWSIPTNLGFCILLGGFTLSAVNTSRRS